MAGCQSCRLPPSGTRHESGLSTVQRWGRFVRSAANFIGMPLDPQGRERATNLTGVSTDIDRRAAQRGGSADDRRLLRNERP
jgi:hypothetical protein